MRITEALLGEHGVFYAWFDAIEGSLGKARTLDEVRELVAVLAPALGMHARLEDDLLFRTIGEGPAVGALAVMHGEHERIEEMLGDAHASRTAADAAAALRDAIALAREHFAKEERIVFPMVDRELGEERLEALGGQWAERRGVGILA